MCWNVIPTVEMGYDPNTLANIVGQRWDQLWGTPVKWPPHSLVHGLGPFGLHDDTDPEHFSITAGHAMGALGLQQQQHPSTALQHRAWLPWRAC